MTGTHPLMVTARGTHVMQVKPNEARCVLREVLAVIEQSHSFLNVSVSGIMPVADRRGGWLPHNKISIVGVQRQLIKLLPIL